ncbi:phosphatase PAP2 family protein [Rickettsia oklahomensis]|uniref:Phosphatase PAP2 family protein n=1 Tax=Rickettsia oklahomensis TaxID=3141789 RepID=A0AAU7BYL4_9RICK
MKYLYPTLNVKGFTFPGGHMSSGVVFYCWFFANIRHALLRIIIVVILTGIGFLLIYKGYHYPVDIIASVTIGIMVIAFVYSLIREEIIHKYPFMLGALIWMSTVPMVAYLQIIDVYCFAWVWTVFWGLFGFTISWWLFYKYLELSIKITLFLQLSYNCHLNSFD